MREGFSKFSSLALISALGCAPSARQIGAEGAASGDVPIRSETSQGDEEKTKAPTPPRARPSPPLSPIGREHLDGGPRLCISTRPDLTHSLVSLELAGVLAPEELHLLKRWLQSAVEQELADVQVTWDPRECSGYFLCLKGPPDRAEELAGAVLGALSGPESASFYRVRVDALASAGEWDLNHADWKLNTAARALRAESPGKTRLDHSHTVDEDALRSIVERYSGAKREQSLPLHVLERQLAAVVDGSTLTISSPGIGSGSIAKLKSQYRAPRVDAPEPTSLTAAPETPLRLADDAPDLAQAVLLWELPGDVPKGTITSALTLLANRWRARGSHSIRIQVQPAGGLYSLPALRIDGAYEDVLSVISELAEEYDRFISTYGSPSEEEWDAAELGAPSLPHFEPRCAVSDGDEGPAERMESGREALRTAGTPTVVIWGSDTPPAPSE